MQEASFSEPRWKLLVDILVVFFVVAFASFTLLNTERLLETQVFGAQLAHAAPLKGYEALQVIASGSKLTLKPGESKQVTIGFQNIGTETWTRDSGAFVSIYTYNPKYRTSAFQDASWYTFDQPAKLQEASVAPGGVGHIVFTMHAPSQTGTYAETFALAAEDVAWIPGGQFTLNIGVSNDGTVAPPSPTPVPVTTTSGSASADTSGLSGLVLLRSTKQVVAKGGEGVTYTVGIKNTGTATWKKREVRVPDVTIASTTPSTQHSSWLSSSVLLARSDNTVAPGAMDLLTFSFSAPKTMGSYTIKYALAVDGAVVPNLSIDIPVSVTSNAPDAFKSPPREDRPATVTDPVKGVEEPMLRVGVLIVDDETDNQVDISCETTWKLRDTNNALLAELKANQAVKAFYKNGKYWFDRGKGLEASSFPLRFIPDTEEAICKVENFDRRVTRHFSYPDNTFRNILELRYNSAKDRTWLINELKMEYYLRGLGETSNISHPEFQKALITVARTYAYYVWEHKTKHASEGFDVTSYADDQVYNGYGQEQRSPNLVNSVQATTGRIVTYNNELALTPYFSRSDGRTRSWSEVWYGDIPWLVSVPTPCDKGKTLWGHGVGMSASEALCQANNGKKWDDILKYFYTGIAIETWWK